MEIKEMIKKYGLVLNTFEDDGKFYSTNGFQVKADNAESLIKQHRNEIYQYLIGEREERQKSYEDRQQKIKQIEGLEEIQNAIEKVNRWNREFQAAMEKDDGLIPAMPQDDIKKMKEQYPRAAAYLLAEKEAYRKNDELAKIGRQALEDIINGMDYNVVLERMAKEQEQFTEKHMWD